MKSTIGSLYLLILLTIMLPANLTFSQDTMKNHEDMATEFIESAKYFRKSGYYKNALIMLKQAYLLYPNNPMVLYSIARSYEEIGECTQAYEWYSKTMLHHEPQKLKEKSEEKTKDFLSSRMDCLPSGDAKLRHSNRQILADSAKLYLNKEFAEAENLLNENILQIKTTEAYMRLALLAFLNNDCEKMQHSLGKAESRRKLEEYAKIRSYLRNNLECETIISDNSEAQTEDPEKIDSETDNTQKVVEKIIEIDSETDNNQDKVEKIIEIDEGPSPLAWVTGGMALASFAGSLIFFVIEKSTETDLNSEVSKGVFDPTKAESLQSSMHNQALVSNICFLGGVALGLTSAALFIFTGGKTEKKQFSVTPIFSPSGSGLAIEGSF